MTARQKATWIAVLDGTQARFFALRKNGDGQVFEEAAQALNADLPRYSRDERSDRPSRALGAGKARGAVEPRHDYNKLAKHNFAREVAGTLDAAFADRRYDRLCWWRRRAVSANCASCSPSGCRQAWRTKCPRT